MGDKDTNDPAIVAQHVVADSEIFEQEKRRPTLKLITKITSKVKPSSRKSPGIGKSSN